MNITEMGTVLAIVVITYLIGLGAKQIPQIKDELIPVVVGVSGGILGAIGMYVMPEFPAKDIMNAIAEANVNFNCGLFPDKTTAKLVFMYLVAHYLTVDFMNAQGTNFAGIMTSRSVGSVSESYTIPQWILNNSGLAPYSSTGYGVKYCSLIRPYLVGNFFVVKGSINAD